MKLNGINILLGLIWLAILGLSFIASSWAIWTIRAIALFFGFVYIKGYFEGRKL